MLIRVYRLSITIAFPVVLVPCEIAEMSIISSKSEARDIHVRTVHILMLSKTLSRVVNLEQDQIEFHACESFHDSALLKE